MKSKSVGLKGACKIVVIGAVNSGDEVYVNADI